MTASPRTTPPWRYLISTAPGLSLARNSASTKPSVSSVSGRQQTRKVGGSQFVIDRFQRHHPVDLLYRAQMLQGAGHFHIEGLGPFGQALPNMPQAQHSQLLAGKFIQPGALPLGAFGLVVEAAELAW